MPMLWQKCTEAGAPPCSLQMPTLRSPRVAASVFGAEFDELPHAGLVKGLEGIVFEDALFDVFAQEFAGVIARVTISHLREVVGAKREKFCVLGNFDSGDESSR